MAAIGQVEQACCGGGMGAFASGIGQGADVQVGVWQQHIDQGGFTDPRLADKDRGFLV